MRAFKARVSGLLISLATGLSAWCDGLPLMRVQGEAVLQGASFQYVAPNMFAGSVFDLAPDTSYDIRLRLTDPDAPAGSAPSRDADRMTSPRVSSPDTVEAGPPPTDDAVHAAAKKAVLSIRETRQPILLETYTYRLRGHFEPDDQSYVNGAELARWRART